MALKGLMNSQAEETKMIPRGGEKGSAVGMALRKVVAVIVVLATEKDLEAVVLTIIIAERKKIIINNI